MAKLNFYDTDAVKAFVLDILIENAELKSDLDYEKKCSNDWFDRYKKAYQQEGGTAQGNHFMYPVGIALQVRAFIQICG